MSELLPCPFCGGEAVTSQGALAHNGSPWFYIECLTCAATAESPEVWNRRAQPEVAQGWQPIETAPKDGTMIDLWTVPVDGDDFQPMDGGIRFTHCSWHDGDENVPLTGWMRCLDDGHLDFIEHPATSVNGCPPWTPTHWMPLPAPPAAIDRARGGGE